MAAGISTAMLGGQRREQAVRTGEVLGHPTEDRGNGAPTEQIVSPRGRTNNFRLEHAQEVGKAGFDTPPPADVLQLFVTKSRQLRSDMSGCENDLTSAAQLELRPANRGAENSF